MIPTGMKYEDAQIRLQEIKATVTAKVHKRGGRVSGDDVSEEVRKQWAKLCGAKFVPQWILNEYQCAPGETVPDESIPDTVTSTPQVKSRSAIKTGGPTTIKAPQRGRKNSTARKAKEVLEAQEE